MAAGEPGIKKPIVGGEFEEPRRETTSPEKVVRHVKTAVQQDTTVLAWDQG